MVLTHICWNLDSSFLSIELGTTEEQVAVPSRDRTRSDEKSRRGTELGTETISRIAGALHFWNVTGYLQLLAGSAFFADCHL